MRKVIGILLAVIMIFSLAACGETEETTESAETTKSVTVTPEPSESAEPSESPEPTESSEEPSEPSEEPSEEATEQAETAEPTEETVSPQQETIEPVSGETVLEMANLLSFWMANSNFGTGRVNLDFDMCCEVSAIVAAFGTYSLGATDGGYTEDYTYYTTIVPEENINQRLQNLFGSNYQAADYTRQEFNSAFSKAVPDYASVPTICLIRDNGQFVLYNDVAWMDTFEEGNPEVLDISLDDDNTCVCTVRYNLSCMGTYDGYENITFWMEPDAGSSYHWVISSIQSGGFIPAA